MHSSLAPAPFSTAPAVFYPAFLQAGAPTPSHTLLLEVGCEELPPGWLSQAPSQWLAKVQQALAEQGLEAPHAWADATPRRLVLCLGGLPAMQAPQVKHIKGPPTKLLYTAEGALTPAALGFLKKNNVSAEACTTQTVGGETYWVVEQHTEGQPVAPWLARTALDALLSLQGPRFMHWGANRTRFARPIRWVLVLWDDEPLPLELNLGVDTLKAAPQTWGHRFLSPQCPQRQQALPLAISGVRHYFEQLGTVGHVCLSTEARTQRIQGQLKDEANRLGGAYQQDEDLLALLPLITEWPCVMSGYIEGQESLPPEQRIPDAVLQTVMKSHQKYVPLQHSEADARLKPYFLVASNGNPQCEATIIAGNQRVLQARLNDASHFLREDLKSEKAPHLLVEGLKGMTFQKGGGTLWDKTERLKALVLALRNLLPTLATGTTEAELTLAATYSKYDLLTHMVYEFDELQGQIGQEYLGRWATMLGQPELKAIAPAVFEQYLPRFAGDAVPTTPVGVLLSMADKLDTLVSLFCQEETRLPSGSKDPLGLRRLVNGLWAILAHHQLALPWGTLVASATSLVRFQGFGTRNEAQVWALLEPFVLQRFASFIAENHYSTELVAAVTEAFSPLEALPQTLQRLKALHTVVQEHPHLLQALVVPAKRVHRLLDSKAAAGVPLAELRVEATLFEDPSEGALWQACQGLQGVEQPEEAAWLSLAQAVEAFCEAVQVFAPQVAVCHNRLALLQQVEAIYSQRWGHLWHM